MNKATVKEKVRATHPTAYAARHTRAFLWHVFIDDRQVALTSGAVCYTATAAWQEAARRLGR